MPRGLVPRAFDAQPIQCQKTVTLWRNSKSRPPPRRRHVKATGSRFRQCPPLRVAGRGAIRGRKREQCLSSGRKDHAVSRVSNQPGSAFPLERRERRIDPPFSRG